MTHFNRPSPGRPSVEDVCYWVYEREVIRIQKERGLPAPWTEDPVLRDYRFCNVKRRDDKVSRWLIDNVYSKYLEGDLWFIAAIARYVNWPPTILRLLEERVLPEQAEKFDPEKMSDTIKSMAADGVKVWGSAYMIYPGRDKGVSKADTIASKFLLPLARDAETIRSAVRKNSVEAVTNCLTGYHGWNTFLSGQVSADLTYFEPFNAASDINTWAPVGPGSTEGLNILFGRPKTSAWKQEEFNKRLQWVKSTLEDNIALKGLTLHDVQNVMCEMSKYWKAIQSEAKPKRLYQPETNF